MTGKSGLVSTGLSFPQARLAKGLFFYAANFQPTTENEDHISPETSGTVDVKVKWTSGTSDVYEMFVMSEHDIKSEFTAARNVLHTYPL